MNVVFLDRDGTLIAEPPDEQIDSLEKLEFVPGIVQGLQLLTAAKYELVIVTNQDDLGTERYPQAAYDLVQGRMLKFFAGEGIHFSEIFVCPHNAREQCACRKPKIGLLSEYLRTTKIDLKHSYVIGDRETDVQLAREIGCKAIRLCGDAETAADFKTQNVLDACRYIIGKERSVLLERNTNETKILIEVSLDGSGEYEISTGLGFFDHMLAQLSRHSGIDMKIHVEGDLGVDEHHTVEDTGIALGEAIRQALGKKRGIKRYGFIAPLDESLAQTVLDLGGRPFCSFKAAFRRERVGELPTELVEDFFRAFADGLRANLHITVTGRNDHHKIEAIFKSAARSLGQAVARKIDSSSKLPSTKGKL
jgi:imidazoleglycerol-phosphate dehydratase/histidinol-phosphatase